MTPLHYVSFHILMTLNYGSFGSLKESFLLITMTKISRKLYYCFPHMFECEDEVK